MCRQYPSLEARFAFVVSDETSARTPDCRKPPGFAVLGHEPSGLLGNQRVQDMVRSRRV